MLLFEVRESDRVVPMMIIRRVVLDETLDEPEFRRSSAFFFPDVL